ncbi:DUF5677 domain-containing protein [Photobacterium swingsii]|uniref:DUF5677 domain-containing protein n=1 Tax=Photobacterium swingsii TaxID=680026 RepID=UPI00406987DA
MITHELFEKFKESHPDLDRPDLELSGVNSGFDLFKENRLNSLTETQEHFKSEVIAIQTQILALNSLVAFVWQLDRETNQVLRQDFPARDLHLASILTNISNTAQSIYELCLIGFNVQADVLYRTLMERTMQAIVLLNNGEDMEKWLEAEDSDLSKVAHYELFAKRERMHKKYEAIERELLSVNPNSQELRAYRKQKMDEASLSVHGASNPVTIGSFSYWKDDKVQLAIFGSPCQSSNRLLNGVIFELWFFFVLFTRTLSNEHGWKPDYKNDLLLGFEVYRYTAHKQFEQLCSHLIET